MSMNQKSPTTIIGRCGNFEVHKVTVEASPRLGMEVRVTEWLEKDLRDAFPGAVSYSKVHSVEAGSLAAQLGIQCKDALCWPTNGPAPIVFHDLCSRKEQCTWELLEHDTFTNIVQQRPCTLYLARKKAKVASVLGSVSISKAMVEKLKTLNSLPKDETEQLLEEVKEDSKKLFEEERDAVLAALPKSFKSKFGQIGFAKWEKQNLPALVVNPFDVPPGRVRESWLTMFERTKRTNNLDRLSHLVYWYGSKDAANHYGFIPQKEFTSYRAGVKKKWHKIPAKIQKRIDGRKKLTKGEQELVHQLDEMQQDLTKDRADRKRGVVIFKEGYEMISEEDLEAFQSGDISDEKDKEDAAKLEAPPEEEEPTKKVPQTRKLRRKAHLSEESEKTASKKKKSNGKTASGTGANKKKNSKQAEESGSSKRRAATEGQRVAKLPKLQQSIAADSRSSVKEDCLMTASSSVVSQKAERKRKDLSSGTNLGPVDTAERVLERFDATNNEVRGHILRLHAQIASLKASHKKEVSQLQRENKGLRDEIMQLKQDMVSVTRVVKKYSN